MLALKRQLGGEEQRIIVSGDADWFSTEGLALRKDDVRLNNFGLFMEMLHYMTYQQFPVDNSRPSPTDDTHYLDIADIGWIKGLFIGLIPLLVLGGAIGFRLKRKGNNVKIILKKYLFLSSLSWIDVFYISKNGRLLGIIFP